MNNKNNKLQLLLDEGINKTLEEKKSILKGAEFHLMINEILRELNQSIRDIHNDCKTILSRNLNKPQSCLSKLNPIQAESWVCQG